MPTRPFSNVLGEIPSRFQVPQALRHDFLAEEVKPLEDESEPMLRRLGCGLSQVLESCRC